MYVLVWLRHSVTLSRRTLVTKLLYTSHVADSTHGYTGLVGRCKHGASRATHVFFARVTCTFQETRSGISPKIHCKESDAAALQVLLPLHLIGATT